MEGLISLLAGGATGLAGTVLGRLFGWLDEWQKRKTIAQQNEHELKLLDMQIKARAEETEREADMARDVSDAQLRMASYRHDTDVGHGSQWVVNVLRLFRPFLTLGIWIVIASIYFSLLPEDAEMRTKIIDTTLYSGSGTLMWWFGQRDQQKGRR